LRYMCDAWSTCLVMATTDGNAHCSSNLATTTWCSHLSCMWQICIQYASHNAVHLLTHVFGARSFANALLQCLLHTQPLLAFLR
jgi:hypothetical protein